MDSADLNTLCHLTSQKEYAWLTDYLSNPRSPADPAAASGEVQGYAPISWAKVAAVVLAIMGIIAGLVYFFG